MQGSTVKQFTERPPASIKKSMRTSSTSGRGSLETGKTSEINMRLAEFKDDVKRCLKELEQAKRDLKENKIKNLQTLSLRFEEIFKKDEDKIMNCLGNLKKILNDIQQIEVEVELELIRNHRFFRC